MRAIYRSHASPTQLHRGFTYLGLLLVVAIMGVGLAGTGVLFQRQIQREKERDLLFVGDQFRRAIALYYERSPGRDKRFPRTLDDLLLDIRYPGTQRYLRRIYTDPMTGSNEWGLVRATDGGIAGVYSLSDRKPVKVATFPARYEAFTGKAQYTEWKFVFSPEMPAAVGIGRDATNEQSLPNPVAATGREVR